MLLLTGRLTEMRPERHQMHLKLAAGISILQKAAAECGIHTSDASMP